MRWTRDSGAAAEAGAPAGDAPAARRRRGPASPARPSADHPWRRDDYRTRPRARRLGRAAAQP